MGRITVRARIGFISLVLMLTWFGEEFAASGPPPWLYDNDVAGIPLHYILFGVLALLLSPLVFTKPRVIVVRVLKRSGLWIWSLVAVVSWVLAVGRGVVGGAPELFVDWRNFVILAAVVVMASRWLAVQPWRHLVLTDIAIGYGLMSAWGLAVWVAGGGSTVLGVRVPDPYRIHLMLAAFGAIVAADVLLNGTTVAMGKRYRVALGLSAASNSLLILLSFRRSLWLLLLVGVLIVAARSARKTRRRGDRFVVVALVVAMVPIVGVLSFGSETLQSRIESINPLSDNSFALTNADHIGDIADAFAVIQEAPILGFGIGSFYETDRIAAWKVESFEVHNAYLNAWLKFGLLGLVAYLGFHIQWIRAMFHAGRTEYFGLVGGAIYIIAEQIPSLVQTSPYSSFQLSVHHGLLLAVLVLAMTGGRRQDAGIEGSFRSAE